MWQIHAVLSDYGNVAVTALAGSSCRCATTRLNWLSLRAATPV
jgi:hypothetical protein